MIKFCKQEKWTMVLAILALLFIFGIIFLGAKQASAEPLDVFQEHQGGTGTTTLSEASPHTFVMTGTSTGVGYSASTSPSVLGDFSIFGTLNTFGDVFFNALATFLDGFISNASSTVSAQFHAQEINASSTLNVDGLTNLNNDLLVTGSATTTGAQNIGGALVVDGLLTVNGMGTSTIAQHLAVGGNLTVGEFTTLFMALEGGNMTATGTLSVLDLSTLNGFISQASSTVSGDFLVSGNATTTGVQHVNSITGVDAFEVAIALGGGSPTIDQLQEYLDNTGSSGFFEGGDLTDGGGGTVDVAAGSGFIRTTNDDNVELQSFKWSASSGVAVADNTTQYVYVDDSGTISLSTNEFLERPDFIKIGVVTDEAGAIESTFKLGVRLEESIGQAGRFIRRVEGISRDVRKGGLIFGESGDANRDVTMTTGSLWWGRTEYTISAIDTSGADTFFTYSAGGQEDATASQWPNEQYDNSGTLTTMINNRWANLFFYIEPDDHVLMVYGREQFVTQAQAENEGVPSTSLPSRITETSVLAGRFTFQKSANTAEILSAFGTTFSSAGVTDHGNLAGLTNDDHTQYILADGSRDFTGQETFTAGIISSTIAVSGSASFNSFTGIGTTSPSATLDIGNRIFGTVDIINGNTEVNGNSTAFLNTFKVGDTITVLGTSRTIASITSNTVLDTTFSFGSSSSDASYTATPSPNVSAFKVFGNGNIEVGGLSTLHDGFISNASSTISSSLHVSDILTSSSSIAVDGDSFFAITGGSVGIGTDSPNNLLEVQYSTVGQFGASTNDQIFYLKNTDSGNSATTLTLAPDSGSNFNIQIYGSGASPANQVNINQRNDAPMVLMTNNSAAMTILGGGNVGIGTDSPGKNLTVQASGNDEGIRLQTGDSNKQFDILYNSTNNVVSMGIEGGYALSRLTFRNNGAERMTINANGAIGMEGFTTPTVPLAFAATLGDKIGLFGNSMNLGVASSEMYAALGNTARHFSIWGGTQGNDEIIRFEGTGNVGIGTASPAEKLTITGGNIRFSTAEKGIEFNGSFNEAIKVGTDSILDFWTRTGTRFFLDYNNNSADAFEIFGNVATTTTSGALFTVLDTGNVGIGTTPNTLLHLKDTSNPIVVKFEGATGSVASFTHTSASGKFAFVNGAGEKVRIDSSGQVGIGTTTPGSPSGAGLVVDTLSDGNQKFALALKTNNTNGSYLRFGRFGAGTEGIMTIGYNYFRPGGTFQADDIADGVSNMSFINDGNIAFGTAVAGNTSPTKRLTITGAGKVIIADLAGTYGGGSAYVCVLDSGELFASDSACP